MTDQTPANTLTDAEAAYWSEKESGRCKNDRGGYYYDGFIDGFVAAREAHTNTLDAAPAPELSAAEVDAALADAETLCRERHPARWTTVTEQRTTCLACKKTAVRELRASLAPAPTDNQEQPT